MDLAMWTKVDNGRVDDVVVAELEGRKIPQEKIMHCLPSSGNVTLQGNARNSFMRHTKSLLGSDF